MRALLIAMAAGVALSACQTTEQVDKANTKVQSGLEQACPKLEAAHGAFVLSRLFVTYPQEVIDTERETFAGVQAFCANPSSVTVESAVSKVLHAIDAINAAKSGG